jgi:hypothetical protein
MLNLLTKLYLVDWKYLGHGILIINAYQRCIYKFGIVFSLRYVQMFLQKLKIIYSTRFYSINFLYCSKLTVKFVCPDFCQICHQSAHLDE